MLDSTSTMEEHDLVKLRKSRRQRRGNANSRQRSSVFLASPTAAVVCMLVALGSIVAFWRGVPSWALLALGIGAVLIVVLTSVFWRSKRK